MTPVIIDSEDTDVRVQSAYVSHQVHGQLLIKIKEHLVDCQNTLMHDISKIIIAAHIISGSDHTSILLH